MISITALATVSSMWHNTNMQYGLTLSNSLIENGIQLLFYVTVLVFTIYSIILAYHWYAYGTKRSISIIALSIYLLVSAIFLLAMSISLFYI